MTTLAPADILLASHEPHQLLTLQAALRPLDGRVLTARTVDEAKRIAGKAPLAAAVVSLDLPPTNGFELLEALRRDSHPELPVVFVSDVTPDEATLRRVHRLGSADFVLLPAPAESLRCKVAAFSELQQLRDFAASGTGAPAAALRLLTRAVSDYAIFFMDTNRRITDWTASAERLFGYRESETVGQPADLIFTPEDRTAGAPHAEQAEAARSGQALDERQHMRKDGTRFFVTGRLIALREPGSGALRGFAKIVWDATQLRMLEDNERKFRQVFETANEGIWLLDADAVVQVVNQRMADLIGYTIAEIVGHRKTDFTFPEDVREILELFEQRRQGRLASSVEIRFRHKDGHAVWVLMSARPMYHDGKFAGALDMFTDMTEHRIAQQRFRLFFESSAGGHALIEPHSHRFLAVNRRYLQIVGRSWAELQHLTYNDITHPDDREQDRRMFGALGTGDVSEAAAEKRYVRPDGTFVWIHLTSTVVRDEHGAPELQLSVVQDITSRKQTEVELEENRTRLRLAIDAADLGVFYHDGGTGQDEWNEQARRLLGLSPGMEGSYAAFIQRVHPDDREHVRGIVEPLFTADPKPRDFDLQFRIVWPDGSIRYLSVNGVTEPRVDATGSVRTHIVGTVRDVTAAKQFELELQQQVEQRTRELQEKTSQLESFCYTVAHDLRAPLRAMNGYAQMADEDLESRNVATVRDYLERIKGSTRRLDELIRDLLTYSRITEIGVSLNPVDLGTVVETALHELETEIDHRQAQVAVGDSLPIVWGEQSLIEQILINLVSNAVKFTPANTRPKVDIFAELPADDVVRLHVRDQGLGIPAEYHERIFKVFERLQVARDYPGTGIGLAIVAKAMQRLGGNYGVESKPGEGSTFWVEFRRVTS